MYQPQGRKLTFDRPLPVSSKTLDYLSKLRTWLMVMAILDFLFCLNYGYSVFSLVIDYRRIRLDEIVLIILNLGFFGLSLGMGIALLKKFSALGLFINEGDQLNQEKAFKSMKSYFSLLMVNAILVMVLLLYIFIRLAPYLKDLPY